MKQVLRGALLALMGISLAFPASAATTSVTIADNRFEPDTIKVTVGDTVKWTRAGSARGSHNVSEENRIFYSGSPTVGDSSYARAFSAGTFRYFCEIHRSDGMKGTVKVPVTIAPAPSGLPFTVRWASGATNTGTKFDVQYRVGSGSWKTWKNNTSATAAAFGKAGRPLSVKPGLSYSFRARSQKGDDESRWSPVKTLET